MLGSTTGNTLEDIAIEVSKRVKATGFDYSSYVKTYTLRCNLCSSTDKEWQLYTHQDRYGLPVRSMQCKRCELIFINPRMNNKAYVEFYDKWYRKLVSAYNGHDMPVEYSEAAREQQADMNIKFMAKYLPSDFTITNVLDIGGSFGNFASKVCGITNAKGYVIDPNKDELKVAADKGLTTIHGSFEDYKPTTDRRYELIAMLKTIEHLQDIQGSLRKIHNLLTERGVLLIDIVNHKWMVDMLKSKKLSTKVDHIYQLTHTTFLEYILRTGFHALGWTDKNKRFITYLVTKNNQHD